MLAHTLSATAQTRTSDVAREKTATNCQYKAELKKSLQREMKDFPLKAGENSWRGTLN